MSSENKKNPFLQNNFAPVHEESDFTDLAVQGELPSDLKGVYMRNGPNPFFEPISYTYPLDGDGMIHALYIDNNGLRYRNRFVKTKGLLLEQKIGHALYGGITMPIPIDPELLGPDDDPGPFKNGAFIHIIHHANTYLALWEGGSAYRMDSDLNTLGEWCPGTAQPLFVGPHSRRDPDTNDLYFINYDIAPPYLLCHRIDSKGDLAESFVIDKPYSTMMHDFVLTKNFIVVFDSPAVLDLEAIEQGKDLLSWRPELGSRIGIISRHDPSKTPVWITTDPFFVFHFANAYEVDQTIVVDFVYHNHLEFGVNNSDLPSLPPKMYRMTIDLETTTLIKEQLSDFSVEFPTINPGYNSKAYQFVYAPTRLDKNNSTGFHALVKFNMATKEEEIYDFGTEFEIGEAVFVPKTDCSKEDEGYLVLFAYDKQRDASDFIIIDATTMGEPIAIIHLPRRVPHGLHGSWFADEILNQVKCE